MDCDGYKKLLMIDVDGSITDGGAATVISEGAYEWEGDPRRGLGYYRVPTSLFTTPNGAAIPKPDIMPHAGECSKLTNDKAPFLTVDIAL